MPIPKFFLFSSKNGDDRQEVSRVVCVCLAKFFSSRQNLNLTFGNEQSYFLKSEVEKGRYATCNKYRTDRQRT